MLKLDYRASDRRAVLSWENNDTNAPWLQPLRRLIEDHTPEARQEGHQLISLPWWSFSAMNVPFRTLLKGYSLRVGIDFDATAPARSLLQTAQRSNAGYALAQNFHRVSEAELVDRLNFIGFNRSLSLEQLRNVRLLAALPAAATFSVPGAGKTTEALATFFYRSHENERLLVICPKNAFAAWDEQVADCMPHLNAQFVRLRGGRNNIAQQLALDPRFILITYQQLARQPDLVAAHCAQYPTFVFLDESHRIKSGSAKQTARAVLDLASLATGKLVMSGTPMPQSVGDLVPQMAFLYPEIVTDANTVVDYIRPVYVRTTKGELGLPPVTRTLVSLPMAPMQYELYKLLKFEAARVLVNLNPRSSVALRALGRSITRILMFTSNPSLLATELGYVHKDLLAATLAEGDGPKLKYLFKRTRQLARQGKKVLIWSGFRTNVEYIADRLSDLGAVYIHGGVDAGDEDDDDTREGKIRRFHDDPDVQVMVANPAAASEGISLHRVCHHAIYLDRSFNAAHYLQSEDRIHRFGLPAGQSTDIEIIECEESIDETVRARLEFKIGEMADVLQDNSLRPEAVPIDEELMEDYDELSAGLDMGDIQALMASLGGA